MKKPNIILTVISIALVTSTGYFIIDKNKRELEIQSFHQSKFDHAVGSLQDGLTDLQNQNWNDAETNLRVAAEDIRLLGDEFNYDNSRTHLSTFPMSHLLNLYAQEIHAWKNLENQKNVSIVTNDLQNLVHRATEENWGKMDYDSFQIHWKQAVAFLQDRQVLDVYEKS